MNILATQYSTYFSNNNLSNQPYGHNTQSSDMNRQALNRVKRNPSLLVNTGGQQDTDIQINSKRSTPSLSAEDPLGIRSSRNRSQGAPLDSNNMKQPTQKKDTRQEMIKKVFLDKSEGIPLTVFDGSNFFGKQIPILDDVFKVESGDITETQKNMLFSMRNSIQKAYKYSKTFKVLVNQRRFLIAKGISQPINILPVHDNFHMFRDFSQHNPTALSVSSFADKKGTYIVMNGSRLAANSKQQPTFYQGDNENSAILKTSTFEEVFFHEVMHALARSPDSEISIGAGNDRYSQITGEKMNTIHTIDDDSIDHSEKISANNRGTYVKINSDNIHGIQRRGNIYVSKTNIIGENSALVNTVLREMDKNYKPVLAYGSFPCYWEGDNGELQIDSNLELKSEEKLRLLEFFLKQDQADGTLNYPFTPLSQNRKKQIRVNAENESNSSFRSK